MGYSTIRKRAICGGEVMSLPRPGHDYCPSCYADDPAECFCRMHCAECGGRTNHTTKQHLAAMRVMCRECQAVPVKDEDELCGECLSALAEMYAPDEGGQD